MQIFGIYLSSLKTEQNCCCPHCRCQFVKFKKPSKTAVVLIAGVTILLRVLRAPGTSLVPKHLRATWPRPEQSHLLPEACSPNGTDNRQQRQRQTERPPPEPSDILKRFYALYDALYDDKIRYYKKKVFKLYCLFNRNSAGVPIWEHGKKTFRKKNRRR